MENHDENTAAHKYEYVGSLANFLRIGFHFRTIATIPFPPSVSLTQAEKRSRLFKEQLPNHTNRRQRIRKTAQDCKGEYPQANRMVRGLSPELSADEFRIVREPSL